MRKASLFIALLVFILLFTGVSEAKENISLWIHSNISWVEAWNKIADDFHAGNPDIKVNIEVFPDFGDKIMSSYAAGTEGDVIDMLGSMLLRYATEGLLEEVPSDYMTAEEMEETFWPVVLASYQHEGKYYGVPFDFNVAGTGVVMNLELLEEAGMTVPQEWIDSRQAGKTWGELVEFSKKLSEFDSEGNMTQAGLAWVNCHEHSDYFAIIFQMGGDYRDFENDQVNFVTKEAKDALQFMVDALDKDKIHSIDFTGRFDAFMEGTAAMTVGGPWYKAVIDREVEGLRYVRLNLPPYIDGAKPYFPVKGGWGCTVSDRGKHKDAAWTFIKFAAQPDYMYYWNLTTGTVPTRKAAVSDERFVNEETLDVVEYGLDMGAQLVVDIDQFIWLIVTPEMRAVFYHEKSIDEAVQVMTDRTNEMIRTIKGK